MIKRPNLHATCITLALGATVTLGTGCNPADTSPLAKYDTANYQPSANGNGFAGIWVLTYNNESTASDQVSSKYQRDVVRLIPIEGVADTYELTACFSSVARYTVVASGNSIALPLDNIWPDLRHNFEVTADGRMTATFEEGTDIWRTWRAVRVSSDPQSDIGNLGIDFFSDDAGNEKKPATCLSEDQTEPVNGSPVDTKPDYYLHVAAENGDRFAEANIFKEPLGQWISAHNGEGFSFSGPINVDTLQSTTHTVNGRIVSRGTNEPGGSASFDIAL